jgi:hypothetical protein
VNVGDVQTFLTNVANLLSGNKGATPASEFAAFCSALDPFKEQSLSVFAQFLRDADGYKQNGTIPVSEVKKKPTRNAARKKASPKLILKSKDDAEGIQSAVSRLQRLYDRFADPTLTHSIIEVEVEQISAEFDPEGLKAVARQFGITSGVKSKPTAKAKILNRIVERKGSFERSEAFSAPSTPLSSPPTPPIPPPEIAQADFFVEVIPD